MSDVSNGIGKKIDSITDTAVKYEISPSPQTGVNREFAETCRVFNTGENTIYAIINSDVSNFDASNAVPIPPQDYHYFVSTRRPIVSVVIGCASGETSSGGYGAL